MFKMLSYLPPPEKVDQARKVPSGRKLHPTRACLMEAGRNLMRHIRRKADNTVINTMDQSLAGQTIIVTGSSSGIGQVVAEDCAVRGARVILACRDVRAGNREASHILSFAPNADLTVYPLDLASFDSVRSFARDVMEKEDRVDVLINNAATLSASRRVTEDGHEETIQVNYLSPVMLTMMLMDHMSTTSPDARIIFVSSLGHAYAREIFLNDLDWKYFPEYRPFTVYYHSKLALMLFVRELSKRADCRNIRVYAADPGICLSGISRHVFPEESFVSKFKFMAKAFLRTPKQAADSILATVMLEKYSHDPDVYYYCDGKERPCSRMAQNDEKAAELWYLTQDLLQLPAMHLLPITSNV